MSAPPPPLPGRLDKAQRRIAFFAILSVLVLVTLWAFNEVLGPFLLAPVLAYVLAPLVRAIERTRLFGRNVPRWVAVVVLYLGFFVSSMVLVIGGAPVVLAELQRLSQELPAAVRIVRDSWLPAVDRAANIAASPFKDEIEDPSDPAIAAPPPQKLRITPQAEGGYEVVLPAEGVEIGRAQDDRIVVLPRGDLQQRNASYYLQHLVQRELAGSEAHLKDGLRTLQRIVASVVTGVFRFFITLVLSAYLLISSDEILAFFRRLVRADARANWDHLLERVDRGLTGVVRGQLVICLVNGVLSAIGFYLLGLKYWALLALVAGAFSIIPIFGSIISSIPVVLVALPQGLGLALLVLAWIVAIHQLEAHLLNPKILGDAARLHPVLVVFVLVAGEHAFGILGAILAVPILSIAQSLFLHFEALALQSDARGQLPPSPSVPPPP